jgi:glycine cleavage system H protein
MIRNIFRRAFCTKYSLSHEWVRKIGGLKAQIGISYHAREELGEIVFVDQSIVNDGDVIDAHAEISTLESVKAAAPVYSPVSGKIIRKNLDVLKGINADPEKEGWICEIELTNDNEFEKLLTLDQYKAKL